MARKKPVIEDVLAIDIADKGKTVGRTPAGEIVMVQSGCVPGDVFDFRYLRKKKGIKNGIVHQIKEYSTDRVDSFCSHFGDCGGCKWQNLSYQKQIELKENAVRQVIKRIAHDNGEKVTAIRGAEVTRHYRNKLEYTFSSKRWLTLEEINSEETFDDRDGLGFHVAGAFDKVLHLDECHLQDSLSNELRLATHSLAQEHGWSYYNIRENHGFLRNLMIRNTTMGQWMVTLILGEDRPKDIKLLFDSLLSLFPQITSWHYMINGKMNSSTFDIPSVHVAGTDHIQEKLDNVIYRISPKSFFQTNSHQAKVLYDVARDLADLQQGDVLYDLYTGTGSIALYMATLCSSVVGIEEIPEAIADAKINAEVNKLENTEFLVGDVKDVLKVDFTEKYGAPDVVITDPPRAGMHADVVETLLALESPKIVYISCNPSTQGRDILLLKEKYELIEVVPVDMFPHTSHIESVALLRLKK